MGPMKMTHASLTRIADLSERPYEVMPIDGVIQEQVINKASASEIKRGAVQRGLRTLRMDGVQKLLAGLTTPEEILRVTQLDIS